MKIPLRYNIGSLLVRRTGTAMAVLGIGFTVAIVVVMMSLVSGLESTFVDTGQDNQLIVLRQGGINEVNSFFLRDVFPTVWFLPGIAKGANGEPLIVGEIIVIINHPRLGGEPSNIIVRGTASTGFYLRP